MNRLLAGAVLFALCACATPQGRDRNAAPVDPCDCGDEQIWDKPPPEPGAYKPEDDAEGEDED